MSGYIKKNTVLRTNRKIGQDPKDSTRDINLITGESTKKPRGTTRRAEYADTQKAKLITTLSDQKKILERRLWLLEWSLAGGKVDPLTWLKLEKKMDNKSAEEFLRNTPYHLWARMLDHVQELSVTTMVTRHVDQVATLNDQHLMAAKLAMAKALEFLSKMNIESKIGKNGQPYFAHFRTTDLKNCIESIRIAQQISRTALGLPSDEGSIHVWQKIQQSVNINPPSLEDVPDAQLIIKDQALLLQKSYTYDDIKNLITAVKEIKRQAQQGVIDVEQTPKRDPPSV